MSQTYTYVLDFKAKTDEFKKGADGTVKSLKAIAIAAGAAFAAKKIKDWGMQMAQIADVQLKAEGQLLTALKGRTDAQQELIKQAQDLQKTTLFGDEETIRAQSLVAAFVDETDQIKTLIPLIQDMAAAKGMDLASAADLVTKTFASSSNALSRYGLEVEGAAGSQERLDSITQALTGSFQGQAATLAKEGLGPYQQWQNVLGDLKEEIGKVFIPIINSMAETMMNIAPKIEAAIHWISDNFETIKTVVIAAGAAITAYAVATQGLSAVIKVATVVQKLFNAAMSANPIGLIIAAIAALVTAFIGLYKHNEEFRLRVDFAAKWAAAAMNKAWIAIKMGGEIMWEAIKAYFLALPRAAKAAWSAVKRIFKGENIADVLKDEIGGLIDNTTGAAKKVAEKYKDQLAEVEMPAWKDYYNENKTIADAEESGKQAAAAYAKGMSGGGASAPAREAGPAMATMATRGISLKTEGVGEAANELQGMGAVLDGLGEKTKHFQEKMAEEMKLLADQARAVGDAVGGAFDNMGHKIVDSLGLADTGFEGFVKGMASTAIQLISMMMAQSIAQAIAGATSSAVATGPAAVFTQPAFIATAVGGILSAFAAIPEFAHGGIVSGTTVGKMGEYPNASINPEVIAPLDKLQGMIGEREPAAATQTIVLDTRVKGEDLVLSTSRAQKKIKRRG